MGFTPPGLRTQFDEPSRASEVEVRLARAEERREACGIAIFALREVGRRGPMNYIEISMIYVFAVLFSLARQLNS
jgi:hypothetical protein